jgi:hypothetical protein
MPHDCMQETRIALIEKDVVDMKGDIKAILAAVAGNGRPGLNMRVDRLERNLWLVFGIGTFAGGIWGYVLKGLLI